MDEKPEQLSFPSPMEKPENLSIPSPLEKPENISVPSPVEKIKRHRSTFTPSQVQLLEMEYKKQPYIGSGKRKELSELLNLSDRAIKIWYQNRRSKERKDILNKCQDGSLKNTTMEKSNNAILRRMLSKNMSNINNTEISNQEETAPSVGPRRKSSTIDPGKIPDMIPLENYKSSEIHRRKSMNDSEINTNHHYKKTIDYVGQTQDKETNISPDSISNPYAISNYNPTPSLNNTRFYNDTFQDANNKYSYNTRTYNKYSPYDKEMDSYKASGEFSIELFKKYIKRDSCSFGITKQENENSSQIDLESDLQTVTSSAQSVASSI